VPDLKLGVVNSTISSNPIHLNYFIINYIVLYYNIKVIQKNTEFENLSIFKVSNKLLIF